MGNYLSYYLDALWIHYRDVTWRGRPRVRTSGGYEHAEACISGGRLAARIIIARTPFFGVPWSKVFVFDLAAGVRKVSKHYGLEREEAIVVLEIRPHVIEGVFVPRESLVVRFGSSAEADEFHAAVLAIKEKAEARE